LSWFEKLIPSRIGTSTRAKGNVPEGLWTKCPGCSTVLYRAELERTHEVCEKCGTHMRLYARARIKQLMDPEGQRELDTDVVPVDALKFKDSKRYKDRLVQATKSSGEKDALIVVRGSIEGVSVVVAVFDFRFMGEHCIEHSLPLVCFSASGGARMQEALYSLLQMGKTSSKLAQLSDRGLPFVSVLTDPTMGGVSASLAMLGDLILAEPGARIGFAGPRVIEQTVREKLPEGFQSSEFLLEHGAIDMIVDRREMRAKLSALLAMLMKQEAPVKSEVPVTNENSVEVDSHTESSADLASDESSSSDDNDLDSENTAPEDKQKSAPDDTDKPKSAKEKLTKVVRKKAAKTKADDKDSTPAAKAPSASAAEKKKKPSKPADKPDA